MSTIGAVAVGTTALGGGALGLTSGSPAPATTVIAVPAAKAADPGTAAPAATTADPLASNDCGVHDGPWPVFSNGEPAGFRAGDKGGVYLWHDDHGWHLRVTHRNDNLQVYSGTITTSGTLAAHGVALERNDSVSVGPHDHVLRFRLYNYGHVDGVDFVTDCAPRLDVSLKGDGIELPTSRVYIGHDGTNPTSVPFVIQRGY